MADQPLGGAGLDPRDIPEIDTSVPHPARVYNYFLGGTDNFEADRVAAEAAIKTFPRTAESARAARAFLRRVVRFLAAEAGIRQFLDIGCGLPSGENVHQVAQSVAPDARIVYVDNDPIVMLHAKTLLAAAGRVPSPILDADLRDPETSSARPRRRWTSASRWPFCFWVSCTASGTRMTRMASSATLTRAMADGSHLAICHLTADIYPELADFARALNERQLDAMLVLRDHAQVTGFFDGLELVEPGVVQLSKWRPQSEAEAAAAAALWGGVARKPG